MAAILCLTGPESTGKSTLAAYLAQQLALPLVTEAARRLLTPGSDYTESDLRDIARAQQQAEAAALRQAPALIADTDILVIAVWWRERFAAAAATPWPAWLHALLQQRTPRHYLLCLPDLAWEPDPLRESQHDRERLLLCYQQLLRSGPYHWDALAGQGPARTTSGLALARRRLGRAL